MERKRILVVEDEERNIQAAKKQLSTIVEDISFSPARISSPYSKGATKWGSKSVLCYNVMETKYLGVSTTPIASSNL